MAMHQLQYVVVVSARTTPRVPRSNATSHSPRRDKKPTAEESNEQRVASLRRLGRRVSCEQLREWKMSPFSRQGNQNQRGEAER